MVQETRLSRDNLIQPLFVIDGSGEPDPVDSMPGVFRYPIAALEEKCREIDGKGIPAVALFPYIEPSLKTGKAEEALRDETLVLRAVRRLKAAIPDLVVMTDIALDPYTDHGHDGLMNEEGTDIDNDRTVELLRKMAVLHGNAGVDFVAPSDMMDGRIGAIRESLDASALTGVGIIAYSAKYASAYYGPFRDAVGSAKAAGTALLGKETYQLNPANRLEALVEIEQDELEGADILMVKPAGPYLDIIRDVREETNLPVAAYQVSGEYAQIHAAAERGWLDLERCRDESLMAIRRAGADLVLTYFADQIAERL
jgi:porphobilinogen synthase